MAERLRVDVSFLPHAGFVSAASPRVPKSVVAASLDELRRRLLVSLLARKGRVDRPVTLALNLDEAAQAEAERRRA